MNAADLDYAGARADAVAWAAKDHVVTGSLGRNLIAALDALAIVARHAEALHDLIRRDHPLYDPPPDVAAILEKVR